MKTIIKDGELSLEVSDARLTEKESMRKMAQIDKAAAVMVSATTQIDRAIQKAKNALKGLPPETSKSILNKGNSILNKLDSFSGDLDDYEFRLRGEAERVGELGL